MVKRTSLITLGLLLAVGVATAWAQQRQITGRITTAVTGEAVVGANVSVVGTAIVALSGDDGRFTLAAPAGDVTLLVRRIGYRRRQVAVPATQSAVEVSMEQDVFNLEAVVVTGQATTVEQRNLANAVSTLNAEQLNRAPTPTIESALQGKIPGALIQMNSGAPGGGGQINLRGVTTINGGVDPLIVVDGLIVSNDAIPSGANAVTAAQAGGNPHNQDNPVNRIADLNPADIDRVEVLKGASAAAIYGAQAANGVVIITTRRGQVGKPRFTLTQRLGTSEVAHSLQSRNWDSTAAVAAFGAAAAPFCKGGCPTFDNGGNLFNRRDLSTETDASVSGGTDQTAYYLSGLVKHDAGTAPNTGYQKQSLRVNLDQRLGDRFRVGVSTNVVHSLAQRGLSNNDNTVTSPYFVFAFTPNFVDLRPVKDAAGKDSFPVNPFAPSNPFQTVALLKNDEDVWRILGTANVKFDAVTTERHHLQLVVNGGVDFFNQRNNILSPPELQFEPQDGQPGTVVLGKNSDLRLQLTTTLAHTYTPASGSYSATTSGGVQYENRDLNTTSILGRSLLSGQQNVDQATSINITQELQPVKNVGLYGQEELLALNQRLLLTVGARADRSSVNGDPDKYHFFPKGAASYRVIQPFGGVDEIKFRTAVGQTGNPPLFGSKFNPDATGTTGGRFGVTVGQRAGDPGIKPERQTEVEGGLDAQLGNNRATLSLTLYQKTVSDLLLEQTLAPSTGQLTRIFNGGKLRNRGVEVAAAVTPVRTPELNWIFRATFFANRSKILELPVPTFQTLGFGTSLGAFQIETGKSATQIVGTEGVVGDANPKFQMSFSSDVDYKRWSLGFLWDWKHGGDVINLTQLLYDFGSNADDWTSGGQQRFNTWNSGKTKVYVQDGSYLKLREVTLSYSLPPDVTSHIFGGISYARFSISGRNLLRFTPYVGLDPEVSNFGNQAIGRNIDVAPFPPNRSFFFSVDLGF